MFIYFLKLFVTKYILSIKVLYLISVYLMAFCKRIIYFYNAVHTNLKEKCLLFLCRMVIAVTWWTSPFDMLRAYKIVYFIDNIYILGLLYLCEVLAKGIQYVLLVDYSKLNIILFGINLIKKEACVMNNCMGYSYIVIIKPHVNWFERCYYISIDVWVIFW